MEEVDIKTAMTATLVLVLLTALPVCGRETPSPSLSLRLAVLRNIIEAVRQHIEAGVDLNLRNNDGTTARHTAAFLCRTESVEALPDGGANEYLRDDFGNTVAETRLDKKDTPRRG